MRIKLAFSLILACLAVTFIVQNTAIVKIDFLAWTLEISLASLVFIMLGTGIVFGWLLNSFIRYSENRRRAKDQSIVQGNKSS